MKAKHSASTKEQLVNTCREQREQGGERGGGGICAPRFHLF